MFHANAAGLVFEGFHMSLLPQHQAVAAMTSQISMTALTSQKLGVQSVSKVLGALHDDLIALLQQHVVS